MTTENITSRAMLASLTISQWAARVHDKTVSREVADNHGSDINLGRFAKTLVDKGALKPVQAAASELRAYHYANTLPWLDAGPRILPAANYFAYTGKVRELREKFDAAVTDFLAAYEDHIADARRRLNGLFREKDYPTRKQIERRFGVTTDFLPFPDAADFRVDLGDIEATRIRDDIAQRTQSAIEAAHRSLWTRCYEAVSHMVERLNAYERDANGKVLSTFRDSLVENIRELVELLPRLNLTQDPELERMRVRIAKELAGEDAATLRDNATVRDATAKAAADILAQMSGYCGDMAEAAE